jgi:hypothetical protein
MDREERGRRVGCYLDRFLFYHLAYAIKPVLVWCVYYVFRAARAGALGLPRI